MTAWVAAVVRVMAHWICGVVDPLGQRRERLRRLVARLHLEARPVDGACRRAAAACRSSAARARSRAARACATARSPAPRRPGRPAICALADMDQAAQKGAGGQHHRAGGEAGGRPPGEPPRHPAVRRASRSSASPSITVEVCVARIACLHRAGVELAVGLGARTAHRRALAAVEHAELDARRGRRPGPSGRRGRRSRGPDGPCRARRSPDCTTSRRSCRSGG